MNQDGYVRAVKRVATAIAVAVALIVAAAPARAQFSAPVQVTDDDLGEPGIDIAPDGTTYINGPVGLGSIPGASALFRSDDGGATWVQTDPGIRQALPGGGDSDVALDPVDGTIYFTDLYLASSTVSVSHDKGDSWSFANPVGGAPVEDRQWLATPGGGIVYHVYNQIPTGIWVSKSIDGGMTYVLGTLAASVVDRGCICAPGTIVAETGGSGLLATGDRVGVIYSTSSGGIGFARSANGGLTWAQSVVSANGSAEDTGIAFPVVVRSGPGTLKAVWLEAVQGRTRVRYSSSGNFGQSWSAPKTLVDAGTAAYPWIDARGSKVSVVLYHTDAQGLPNAVPEGSEWFAKYLESTNGGSSFSSLTTIDTTPVKTGPICTEGTGCSEDRELLDFFQVAVHPTTLKAYVTWTHSKDDESDTEILFAKQM